MKFHEISPPFIPVSRNRSASRFSPPVAESRRGPSALVAPWIAVSADFARSPGCGTHLRTSAATNSFKRQQLRAEPFETFAVLRVPVSTNVPNKTARTNGNKKRQRDTPPEGAATDTYNETGTTHVQGAAPHTALSSMHGTITIGRRKGNGWCGRGRVGGGGQLSRSRALAASHAQSTVKGRSREE